jgi:predicted nucleic acid-binding protein
VPTESHPDTGERAVVADAGPLLHLDELDALQVLSDFREIIVVPAVREELIKHRPAVLERCANLALLESAPHSDAVTALTPLYTLHHGEREALACCVQRAPALFLTDDTAARLAAQALDIQAHGTIGLLVRAVRKRHRTAAEAVALLSAIPECTTLHIRPALLRDVIEQVRRAWDVSSPK